MTINRNPKLSVLPLQPLSCLFRQHAGKKQAKGIKQRTFEKGEKAEHKRHRMIGPLKMQNEE